MWSTFLLSACGTLSNYIPQNPSLSAQERELFAEPQPVSTERATNSSNLPVFPFFIFGLAYERDIVIETTDPAVDMIEIAELAIPGSTNDSRAWIAKISDQNGRQSLYSNRPEILSWMPSVNAPRFFQPSEARFFLSDSNQFEARVRLEDQRILELRAQLPETLPKTSKPNRSTFNHSQDITSAVLEISHQKVGINADLWIDGKSIPAKRILGVFPIKAMLSQTQGGLLTADATIDSDLEQLMLEVPGNWAVPESRHCNRFENHIVCQEGLTKSTYFFEDGGFIGAEVRSFDGTHLFGLWLNSPMPPINPRLSGTHLRLFSADVGGMAGAGTGELRICRKNEAILVDIQPSSPDWFANRPMRSQIDFQSSSSWKLVTTRVDSHEPDSCPP